MTGFSLFALRAVLSEGVTILSTLQSESSPEMGSRETLEMGARESSVRQRVSPHGSRGDDFICGRAFFSITGSLLGGDHHAIR